MYFSTALAAAASVALAQAVTIPVTVGADGALKFVPNDIKASVGDQLEFSFFAKNHSVTQSSFADPCHPLAGGFFSTFIPTNSTSDKVFTVTVNDTKPIWIYCAQTAKNHCQSGMVASVNAPATGNTLAAFTLKAGNATTSTSPPDTVPIGGILAAKGSDTVVTGSATSTVTTTFSSAGGLRTSTYATTYPTTYTTDSGSQISAVGSGSGSAPTVSGGSSSPSVTTSAKAGAAATGMAANGAMVGAVVLGALAML